LSDRTGGADDAAGFALLSGESHAGFAGAAAEDDLPVELHGDSFGEGGKRLLDVLHRGETILGFLGHHAHDDLGQRFGDRRVFFAGIDGGCGPMSFELLVDGLERIGDLAGEEVIHGAAEAVLIGATIDVAAVFGLLRGDVIVGAETILSEDHGEGEFVLIFFAAIFPIDKSEAEVEQLDRPVLFDEDVGRLDIAMDHAAFVSVVERIGKLGGDIAGLSGSEDTLTIDAFLKIDPLDEFHDDEVDRTVEIIDVFEAVGFYDTRVIEFHSDAGFELEAGAHGGVVLVPIGEDFEGDEFAGVKVPGEIHPAHPPCPENFEEAIVADPETAMTTFKEPFGLKAGEIVFPEESLSHLDGVGAGGGLARKFDDLGELFSREQFTLDQSVPEIADFDG